MLAASPAIGYVHEPFNPDRRLDLTIAADRWFLYVDERNGASYSPRARDVLGFRYPVARNLRAARSAGDVRDVLAYARRYRSYRRARARPLVKDPIALLSAEWLARSFAMDVVVVVRHPAAFASSIVRFGWRHPFADFLAQPRLMDAHLRPFAPEIRRFAEREQPLLDQAILLWRILHHVMRTYRDREPAWSFVRHEDLSRDPDGGFAALYGRLALAFDDRARHVVARHSDPSNPAEAAQAQDVALDSRANVSAWKRRLDAAEVERVRAGTADVWPAFYTEADWT